MGEDKSLTVNSSENAPVNTGGQRLSGLVDVVLFIAILAFTAVALLAIALAAPLAIVATALAGAVSAFSARGAKRGGWRVAGAA